MTYQSSGIMDLLKEATAEQHRDAERRRLQKEMVSGRLPVDTYRELARPDAPPSLGALEWDHGAPGFFACSGGDCPRRRLSCRESSRRPDRAGWRSR